VGEVDSGFALDSAWSPDNSQVVLLADDRVVRYSAERLELTGTISPTGATVTQALAPNGERLAGMNAESVLSVWDATDGKAVLELKEAGAASGLSFTPNSNYLATASADRIEIRLWDVDTDGWLGR
jgi:WD40 repeat protein